MQVGNQLYNIVASFSVLNPLQTFQLSIVQLFNLCNFL